MTKFTTPTLFSYQSFPNRVYDKGQARASCPRNPSGDLQWCLLVQVFVFILCVPLAYEEGERAQLVPQVPSNCPGSQQIVVPLSQQTWASTWAEETFLRKADRKMLATGPWSSTPKLQSPGHRVSPALLTCIYCLYSRLSQAT